MFPRHRFELSSQPFEKKTKPLKQFATILFLLLVAGFVLLNSLSFPLFEPDEARNSQLALNVIDSGQWMSLSLADDYYWDKPPLQIWMIAASYKAFGVSPFTTRLPGAIASLLTILILLVAGKRIVGFRSAAFGAAMLILTTGFIVIGRYVTMDAALTTMTTATLLSGFIAIRQRFEKSSAITAGIACGIGILIKGPVIAVLCFPPLIVSAWLLAKEHNHTKTRNRWLWFLVPMGLIAGPWFIAMAIIHPDFLTYFFWTHHVVRFANGLNHFEPAWYYAIGIFLLMFPASYLLPSVARFATSRKPENRLWRTKEHGFLLLSAVWIVLFFSLSQSKLPTYIVPAFPLVCLLMGVLIQRKIIQTNLVPPTSSKQSLDPALANTSRKTFLGGLPRRAPLELLFWITVISMFLLLFFQSGSAPLVMVLSACIIIPLAILAVRKRSKPKLAWSCFGALALFTVILISHRLIPALSASRSLHIAALQLNKSDEIPSDSPIVFFGEESYGVAMTIKSPVKRFDHDQSQALIKYLNWNPNSVIVSAKDQMAQLRKDLPYTIIIEKCEGQRHLYVTRPNKTVIARELQSRTFR